MAWTRPRSLRSDHDEGYQESFDAVIAHFVSCLRSGAAFETDPAAGQRKPLDVFGKDFCSSSRARQLPERQCRSIGNSLALQFLENESCHSCPFNNVSRSRAFLSSRNVVARLTLSIAAISRELISPVSNSLRGRTTPAGVVRRGRPKTFPRARAEARSALVLSKDQGSLECSDDCHDV